MEWIRTCILLLERTQGGVIEVARLYIEVAVLIFVDAFEVDEYFLDGRGLEIENFAFLYVVEAEFVELQYVYNQVPIVQADGRGGIFLDAFHLGEQALVDFGLFLYDCLEDFADQKPVK